MNIRKNSFVESAFGDIYDGTFFSEDLPKHTEDSSSKNSVEDAIIREATSKVRMPSKIDADHEAEKAIRSACDFGGNFGKNIAPAYFAGKIFGGI